MTAPFKLTRRGLVAGVTATLAGCGHENLPFVSVDPPPLVGAWMWVTESGTGQFLLLFDGDIQSLLDRAPFGRSDLVDVAKGKDVNLQFEPVDASVPPEQIPGDTDTISDERTVQGRIRGFAKTKKWPVHTWYSTKAVTYEKELPEEATAPLYITFPNGYQYELPADHEQAKEFSEDGTGLFEYEVEDEEGTETTTPTGTPEPEELDPERTFPNILHYSHPDLLGMWLAAKYRNRAIADSYHLFKWSHYEDEMYKAARRGVAEVMTKLGEAAIEEVLTTPLPATATVPLDVKGFHDAVQTELPKLENALDSLEDATEAAVNNSWMHDLTPDSRDAPPDSREEDQDEDGLYWLQRYARREAQYRNPTVVTTDDNEAFVEAFEAYEQLLADQRAITARLLSPDSIFMTVSTFGREYWERLHEYAETLLWESDRMLRKEQESLEELRSDLGEL